MRAGWLFAVAAGVVWGQTAPDTATEVAGIRDNIRAYLDQLPRITCTEDTRQTVRAAGTESTETREDSCDTRHYKLLSVLSAGVLHSPNRAAADWRERLTEASLPASTGFLAALVAPRADAGFRWVRTVQVGGRAVSIYAFQVAMPDGFLLSDSKGSVRAPFRGLLYADAATEALVHVQIECVGIPSQSEYIGADVAVEFDAFDVNGRRFTLPAHSRVRFRMKQGDTTNEAAYSAYRIAEFGTDTQIKFGDEAP